MIINGKFSLSAINFILCGSLLPVLPN